MYALFGCVLFFFFLFLFFFFVFWYICLFFLSCPHLLILPRFPCSVSVLSGAGFFALGKRSRCELRLWIALQYHLIDVLGSCISVQPAEIVPMERWLNFQHRRRDWTAAVLFESLLQEVDVFSIFVHLRRDQMITDRKLGFEARCTCSYEFQSLKSWNNDNGRDETTPQINDMIGWKFLWHSLPNTTWNFHIWNDNFFRRQRESTRVSLSLSAFTRKPLITFKDNSLLWYNVGIMK